MRRAHVLRLAMWHVHNEYGSWCHCDDTAAAFRRCLVARHGSLSALNDAWTTAFWGQHYSAWEQIMPPRATQYLANPGQVLDFRRYLSDEMLSHFREQKALLASTGVPVTTNFVFGDWVPVNQRDWAREVDLVAIDHYPAPGALRDLLGIRVEEFHPLAEPVTLSTGDTGSLWSERVHLAGAEALATYPDGSPAITRAHPGRTPAIAGSGSAYYVSTRLTDEGLARLLDLPEHPDGLELVRQGRLVYAINYSAFERAIPVEGLDPVTGTKSTGRLTPGGFAVLEEGGFAVREEG